MMMRLQTKWFVILLLTTTLSSCSFPVRAQGQQVVARVKPMITVNNKEFKDLNANGVLDDYENWELPVEKRVEDLLSWMSLEEKASLMLIAEYLEVENGKLMLLYPPLDRGIRYFIFRGNQRADIIARLNNELQEAAEASRLGIPAVIISNQRNHESTIPNIREEEQFSHWPDPLGLAAMRDYELTKQFAKIAARQWRATGLHKMYGYSVDVATDPLWARVLETFGEDPGVVSKMITALIEGFQGAELNRSSVSLTIRHYPGVGAREKGTDPHFEEGKYNIWPTEGSLLKYHIPPFQAAIEAKATSIMPYYAIPSNQSASQGMPPFAEGQQFEEVGFAMNESFLRYLREELGFSGYVNSDTLALTDMAWGAKDLPVIKRFAKAINAGTHIFSGVTNPEPIVEAVERGLVDEAKINESVTFLLTEMMKLGLFEKPYVDPDEAIETVNDPKAQELADLAHRKAVVLLRNDHELLPLHDDKLANLRLYVERFPGGKNGVRTAELRELIRKYDPAVTVVDRLEEATHALIWVVPRQELSKREPSIEIGH